MLFMMEPTSGVTMARLLSSPMTQQCFSAVLTATASWAKTQSIPAETCIHFIPLELDIQ